MAVVVGLLTASAVLPGTAEAAAPRLGAWKGGVDLYRAGTFTTQRSWLWCTAADVQIVRNIVRHQRDHSTRSQRTYFEWMRKRDRYRLPLSAGVDPAGWTAGLRHFVDDRYRLVASRTFDGALRSAVKHLRLTNLPVAITVSHGNHAWILTGFRATADPAKTAAFKVTSVRVVGPLYGLQSRNGYDMPPNTRLTPAQFKRFFTPWKYKPKRMIWDGRYVSIQPIPRTAAASAPVRATAPAKPAATSKPIPAVVPTLTAGPMPTVQPAPAVSPTPTAGASSLALAAFQPGESPRRLSAADVETTVLAARDGNEPAGIVVVALVASVVAAVAALTYRVRRRAVAG